MDYIKNTVFPSSSKAKMDDGFPCFFYINVNINELKEVIVAFESGKLDTLPETNNMAAEMKIHNITESSESIKSFLDACVKHVNGVAEMKKMSLATIGKKATNDEEASLFIIRVKGTQDFLTRIYICQQRAHYYLEMSRTVKSPEGSARYLENAKEDLKKRSEMLHPVMLQLCKSLGVATHDPKLEKEMLDSNPELSELLFVE